MIFLCLSIQNLFAEDEASLIDFVPQLMSARNFKNEQDKQNYLRFHALKSFRSILFLEHKKFDEAFNDYQINVKKLKQLQERKNNFEKSENTDDKVKGWNLSSEISTAEVEKEQARVALTQVRRSLSGEIKQAALEIEKKYPGSKILELTLDLSEKGNEGDEDRFLSNLEKKVKAQVAKLVQENPVLEKEDDAKMIGDAIAGQMLSPPLKAQMTENEATPSQILNEVLRAEFIRREKQKVKPDTQEVLPNPNLERIFSAALASPDEDIRDKALILMTSEFTQKYFPESFLQNKLLQNLENPEVEEEAKGLCGQNCQSDSDESETKMFQIISALTRLKKSPKVAKAIEIRLLSLGKNIGDDAKAQLEGNNCLPGKNACFCPNKNLLLTKLNSVVAKKYLPTDFNLLPHLTQSMRDLCQTAQPKTCSDQDWAKAQKNRSPICMQLAANKDFFPPDYEQKKCFQNDDVSSIPICKDFQFQGELSALDPLYRRLNFQSKQGAMLQLMRKKMVDGLVDTVKNNAAFVRPELLAKASALMQNELQGCGQNEYGKTEKLADDETLKKISDLAQIRTNEQSKAAVRDYFGNLLLDEKGQIKDGPKSFPAALRDYVSAKDTVLTSMNNPNEKNFHSQWKYCNQQSQQTYTAPAGILQNTDNNLGNIKDFYAEKLGIKPTATDCVKFLNNQGNVERIRLLDEQVAKVQNFESGPHRFMTDPGLISGWEMNFAGNFTHFLNKGGRPEEISSSDQYAKAKLFISGNKYDEKYRGITVGKEIAPSIGGAVRVYHGNYEEMLFGTNRKYNTGRVEALPGLQNMFERQFESALLELKRYGCKNMSDDLLNGFLPGSDELARILKEKKMDRHSLLDPEQRSDLTEDQRRTEAVLLLNANPMLKNLVLAQHSGLHGASCFIDLQIENGFDATKDTMILHKWKEAGKATARTAILVGVSIVNPAAGVGLGLSIDAYDAAQIHFVEKPMLERSLELSKQSYFAPQDSRFSNVTSQDLLQTQSEIHEAEINSYNTILAGLTGSLTNVSSGAQKVARAVSSRNKVLYTRLLRRANPEMSEKEIVSLVADPANHKAFRAMPKNIDDEEAMYQFLDAKYPNLNFTQLRKKIYDPNEILKLREEQMLYASHLKKGTGTDITRNFSEIDEVVVVSKSVREKITDGVSDEVAATRNKDFSEVIDRSFTINAKKEVKERLTKVPVRKITPEEINRLDKTRHFGDTFMTAESEASWRLADKSMREWATKGDELSVDKIKKLHELMNEGNEHVRPGIMRNITNNKSDVIAGPTSAHLGVNFRYVDEQMSNAVKWYTTQKAAGASPAELAAGMGTRLMSIQPFLDGNKRMTRMVMDWILIREGLPPAALNPKIIDHMLVFGNLAKNSHPDEVLKEVTHGIEEAQHILAMPRINWD